MTKPTTHALNVIGAVPEPIILANGTLWSHAATLGTFFYRGEPVTLDRAAFESMIRNFNTGYPKKVPVDYEHGSGIDSRGMPVPKGGDVLELRGVFAESDFTGDLKQSAEKLAARVGRSLSDPSSFGLWMRWEPLVRALAFVKAGEITEHSIEFSDDYINPNTGQAQGPTLLAVALTNRPFLDGMIPVAASQGRSDGTPAAPAPNAPPQEHSMPDNHARLFSALAAVTLTAPTDEENAITQLSALGTEIKSLRAICGELATATGETDPTKALAKVKTLTADVARFQAEAATARKARIDGEITATFKKYEDRLVPAQHAFFRKQLSAELESGVPLDQSEAAKAIEAMPKHGITDQTSLGDKGDKPGGDDEKIDAKAQELMTSDEEVKNVKASQGFAPAFQLALRKARTAVRR